MSYAPAQGGTATLLPIPQATAVGEYDARPLLPSFVFLPASNAQQPDLVVGELAKLRSGTTPGRVISSAKSWLCHPGVDRHATILPPDAPDDVTRLSPVDTSALVLDHLRKSWDTAHPESPLHRQDVTLTVPASFDPIARDLTVEAAARAGIPELTLLEEPQAALYHWLEATGDAFRDHLAVDDVVLVIDVGGGTTDFSLVQLRNEEGTVALHRLAVGEHVLLGGDNMDLALAHLLSQKLTQQGVTRDRWLLRALTQACRSGKERLLTEPGLDAVTVSVPSRGSKLVGRVLQAELTRSDVESLLLHGFFKPCALQSMLSLQPSGAAKTAVSELGLPYAKNPAVLDHLATFLTHQATLSNGANSAVASGGPVPFVAPTAVLFNGGVFKSTLLREHVTQVVNGWLADAGKAPVKVLESEAFDHACALGAARFGLTRSAGGIRILGGSPRSYYLGIESAMPAIPGFEPPLELLCVLAKGSEAHEAPLALPHAFSLTVGEPVRFRFFSSSVRDQDDFGATVPLDVMRQRSLRDVREHDALELTLPIAEGQASLVPVTLAAMLTTTGTLSLFAEATHGEGRWRIPFDVSSAGVGDRD